MIKQSFTPKRIKSGAYHSSIIAAVIAIVVVINLMVTQMNVQIDLSDDSMYTLTEETRNLVAGLDDDITVYYVVQDGAQTPEIQNIVKQYNGLSGKVRVVEKDPVLYPNFTSDYTDEEVENESIIVVNKTTGISKYVPYTNMLVSEIDYTTYQSTTTAIDVEGQITSAIQFVTSDNLPKMYVVNGHGEAAIGDSMKTSIEKLNVQMEDLQTLTATSIPEDCSILVVNAPTSDLTKEEANMIKDYLKNGGKAILNTAYTDNKMTQYDALLAYYGISKVNGVVIESTGNYVGNYPTYLVPKTESHDITNSIDNYLVLAVAQGLEIASDIRSTLTIDPLITTSDNAYSKIDLTSDDIAQAKDDIQGPFVLGTAITESVDDKETKIVTVSTGYLLEDSFLSTGSLEMKSYS